MKKIIILLLLLLSSMFVFASNADISSCTIDDMDVTQGTTVQSIANITNGTHALDVVWWEINNTIYSLTNNDSSSWWLNLATSSMAGNYTSFYVFVNDTSGNITNLTCGSLNVNVPEDTSIFDSIEEMINSITVGRSVYIDFMIFIIEILIVCTIVFTGLTFINQKIKK